MKPSQAKPSQWADLEPTGAELVENSTDLQAAFMIQTDLAQKWRQIC